MHLLLNKFSFIDLYEISAKHLKSKFPELKIGGYASCGFYDIFEIKEKLDSIIEKNKDIIVCMHYPPISKNYLENEFERLKDF